MFCGRRRSGLGHGVGVVVRALELVQLGLVERRLLIGQVAVVRGVSLGRTQGPAYRFARDRGVRCRCHAGTLRPL